MHRVRFGIIYASSTVDMAQTCAGGMGEWGAGRAFGFSAILSLGDRSMSTSATCLIISPSTATRGASLLYIESNHDVQKFMSAAPAAARAKPVSWSSPAGMRKAPERRNSYRQNQ